MDNLKKVLWALLFPPMALVIFLTIISTIMLIYAFACEGANEIIVYLSYFLSAYALTIVCARTPKIYRILKNVKQDNKYINMYTSQAGLRVKISLYGSVVMNGLYAIMQLVLGFINHSVWFYSLAGYYLLLVIMRFFLLKEMKQNRWGEDRFFELLLYRFCGLMLFWMNIALAVVLFYIVKQNRGFEHHFIVTIAMATYTFTALTMAIINIVKYRKYNSPVMSATKAISLVSSLVSMISLETAMITAFGDEGNGLFRQIITASTGTVVCIVVLYMALYMTIKSTKEINQLKQNKGESDNGK